LIERARTLRNLDGGPAEFQAHIDFKFFGLTSVPVPGRMEYAWRPPGQWHREISIPNYFREIDNSGEGVISKDRTSDYEPLRVGQMYELFTMAVNPHASKDSKWGRVHSSSDGNCVEAKLQGFEEKWCFDAVSGVLKSVDDPSGRAEFGEFQKIGERQVPTSLRFYYKKKLAIEAKASWDFESRTKDELYKPSTGAVDWPLCESMVMPTKDHMPDPVYPRRTPGVTGDDATVVLYVTIAADGKLRMPYVVESGGPVFDGAAVVAIREWKFHPATCDGKPIPVQIHVQVNFHYGRGGPELPMYR